MLRIQDHEFQDGTKEAAETLAAHIQSLIDKAQKESAPKRFSMDTAPKDGTSIILFYVKRDDNNEVCCKAHWMRGGHCIEDHPAIESGWYTWTGNCFDWPPFHKLTGWSHLPAAPSHEGESK